MLYSCTHMATVGIKGLIKSMFYFLTYKMTMTTRTLFIQDANKMVSLAHLVDLQYSLLYVDVSSADVANCHEDVVVKNITSEFLNVFGERCAKHQRLTLGLRRHSHLVNNLCHVRQEAQVQHTIGLVQNQILHLLKTYLQ